MSVVVSLSAATAEETIEETTVEETSSTAEEEELLMTAIALVANKADVNKVEVNCIVIIIE